MSNLAGLVAALPRNAASMFQQLLEKKESVAPEAVAVDSQDDAPEPEAAADTEAEVADTVVDEAQAADDVETPESSDDPDASEQTEDDDSAAKVEASDDAGDETDDETEASDDAEEE